MDYIVRNPGLEHVALQIFAFLDAKNLAKCFQVSRFWHHFIASNRTIWLKRLTKLRQNHFIYYHGPSKLSKHPKILKEIIFHFENHENPAKLQKLIEDLNQNSAQFQINVTKLLYDNRLILKSYPSSIVYPTTKKRNWTTILHLTIVGKQLDDVIFLLDLLKQNGINVNARDSQGKTALTNLVLWIRFVISKKKQNYYYPSYQESRKILYFICEHFDYYRFDFNFKWNFIRGWFQMSIFEYLCYEQEIECVELILKNDIHQRIKNRDQVQIFERNGWKSISFILDSL